jgi:hypothetical protein
MTTITERTVAAAIAMLTAAGAAQADEEMDRIIEAAAPYMHHSCVSIMEEFGEDSEEVAEAVRLMAMVSLYNRQIDVLAVIPEESDREMLRDEFVAELEDACDGDAGRLLAGAVDQAVRETIEAFD